MFQKPCRYCGSQAKRTTEHAKQCPVMFQLLAVRWLKQRGGQDLQATGACPPTQRKYEAEPQHTKFISPMQTALQKGARKPAVTAGVEQTTKISAELSATRSTTTIQDTAAPSQIQPKTTKDKAGTLHQFFGTRSQPTQTPSSPSMPWTCRLRLRNPRSLCYSNAAILALYHALLEDPLSAPELAFLLRLGENAANRSTPLSLTQLNLFRKLTPS